MLSKERQIKNSFIYLIPSLVDNFIPFLTLPIFSRILFPEDYGVLALAQIFAVFGCGLANLALLSVYDRSFFQYRHDPLRSGQLLFSITLLVAGNSLVLMAVAYFAQQPLSVLFTRSPHHGNILLVALAAECTISLRQYYLFYFKNREEARVYMNNYLISSVLTFILSLFFVGLLRMGVIGIVYGRLLGSGAALVSLHQHVTRLIPFSLNRSLVWETLKISFPLTPPIFYGTVVKHFDKYMLGLLSTISGVGIYSIGQKMSYMIFVYMTSLQNVFQPQVYKRLFELKEEAGEAVGKYLTPFVYISIFVGLLVSLFAEEVISLLTPAEYHGAIPVVIILSMYYGFLFWGKINSVQLLYKKRTGTLSLLTLLTIALNILLGIPMIKLWGAEGAAWNMFLVGLLSGGVAICIAQNSYRIRWENKKVFTIYLVFFGASLLMIFLRWFSVDYTFRVAGKFICLGIYLYLGTQWHIVNKENFNLIRGVIWPVMFVKTVFR